METLLNWIWVRIKEIYEGVRKNAWMLLPLSSLGVLIRWFFTEWLPARAQSVLAWVLDSLPVVNVNPAEVGVAWDRINQWVPLSEILMYGAAYLLIAGMVTVLKWVKSLIPFA